MPPATATGYDSVGHDQDNPGHGCAGVKVGGLGVGTRQYLDYCRGLLRSQSKPFSVPRRQAHTSPSSSRYRRLVGAGMVDDGHGHRPVVWRELPPQRWNLEDVTTLLSVHITNQ